MPDHLLGTKEAAALLGVSKQGLFHLVESHHDFPAPTATLASGRIWNRADVESWATAHGRTLHQDDA
jgi:predicted DNA-binding transcriptional regulator AlpA